MTQGSDNIIRTACGKRGNYLIADTSTHEIQSTDTTDSWTLIHCLEDTVFVDMTDNLCRSSATLVNTSSTVPQGTVLGGDYTKIRLKSGKVILYV